MKRIHYLYTLGLLLALTTGFVSCSDETAAGGETPRPVTVSLQIGAGQEALTKAKYNGDEYAEKGEFMHTLSVFVCDGDNKIVEKLKVYDLNDALEHTFENIKLPSGGSYTFYGFANCESLEELDDVLALDKGNKMQDDVVNNTLIIANPHEGLSFKSEENRIPMSGKAEKKQITSDQTVTIEMIRMVSRIKVTVNNLQTKDLEINDDLKLHGVAQNIKLFGIGDGFDGAGSTEINIPLKEQGQEASVTLDVLDPGEHLESGYIYIPESYNNSHRFTLTVGGDNLTGNTSTSFIRNHIYPFIINLREYMLNITVSYEAPPIGGIVKPTETSTDSYNIQIIEGSTFTMKAKLMKGDKDISCKWFIKDTKNNIPIDELNSFQTGEDFILTGSIPSQPTGQTTTFTLTATEWLSESNCRVHDFDLTIKVKPIGTKTNSATTGSYPLMILPQVVGMY